MACNHENIARQAENNESLPFKFTTGNDPPADPATQGYFVNHVGFLVADINRSREWYSTVLGMRHVFTIELSSEYTIMYMAHSQGGEGGTEFQSGSEMIKNKNKMAGLIEFHQFKGNDNRTYEWHNPRMVLSHLGLIVPDINAAQARFESLGVRILKRVGELDFLSDTQEIRHMAGAWGFPDPTTEQGKKGIAGVAPALEAMGIRLFCMIADPDGNVFEVQPQVGALV